MNEKWKYYLQIAIAYLLKLIFGDKDQNKPLDK